MGALPSRESNEDPSSVFFANCGSHIVFHIPLTDHFFSSPDSLAFRQLFHARNNQSALYCFEMKDISSVTSEDVAEAFRKAQEEDWGEEAEEIDPSLHYCDEEIDEKIRECVNNGDASRGDADTAVRCLPRVGRHLRPSIEDREELYRVLVTEPMEGTLVDTDEEMCALVEQEQRWRAALSHFFNAQAQQRSDNNSQSTAKSNCGASGHSDDGHTQPTRDTSARQQHNPMRALKEGGKKMAADISCVAESNMYSSSSSSSPQPKQPPPPPDKFLYPLPQAIALRMTTEEEEEMRAEYCRKHNIPYVAPTFHDVRPTPAGGPYSQKKQHAAPRTVLPVVERRHYHFEDDPQYRDGRVHLVEEHGVLYHFAYFPQRQSQTTTAAAAAADDSSPLRGANNDEARGSAVPSRVLAAGTTPISQTPIVCGRCLHDVVYCEKSWTHSDPSASSTATCTGSEPEVAPPVRYGWCARCGEQVKQRMDYTQLRRLKSSRVHRRAAREGHAEGAVYSPKEGGEDHGEDDDMDDVASNTERVDEEGEEEFIINITPVRVVGMNGLLPSRSRGTQWLRGYDRENEAAEDAWVEQLDRKPPVMRVCRFIEGSVGDKIVNRAVLVTLLSYRPMCRQAGLRDSLTRPVRSMCVLSNIPYLQMVRETFFRAKAAVAEVDDNDLLLRNWLDVVDRENNFHNFINANLYMMRDFTPPERAVRQREQATDDAANASAPMNRRPTTADASGGEGVSTGTCPASASSAASLPYCETDPFPCAAAEPSLPAPSGAVCTSADRAEMAADATTQRVSSTRSGKRGESKAEEGDGCELRSHHLTRALEEVTIGRPEGHGLRDQVEEEEDDDDVDEEGEERGTGDGVAQGDTATKFAAGREKSKKALRQKNLERPLSAFSPASQPLAVVDSCRESPQHRCGGNEDGGETSGKPSPSCITTPHTQSNAVTACAATGQCKVRESEAVRPLVRHDDDDMDLSMEEEGRGRTHTPLTSTPTPPSCFPPPRSVETPGRRNTDEQYPPPHPAEVPPRPNFQLFSSRLEPHAPLSLCRLFDYDARADRAAKTTVTQLAAAVSAGVAPSRDGVDSGGGDGVVPATAASADAPTSNTAWPSYVQHDILRENERQQAEPKATRRPSHALYECGMLSTTRGRNFLFLLREDCVQALLFYCSAAAAPIFIGAYIEPVDTTSVSYGGAVRLQRASTLDVPPDDSDHDDSDPITSPAHDDDDDSQRVLIGPVEDMEVMAEYFEKKDIITCFSVSDVDKLAPGPSAAHRLHKMVLPSALPPTSNEQHPNSCRDRAAKESSSLATRQARELAKYGHVFTYAANEFCDGDLVVFNFEQRRWEHYEHVQLRRRFAAKAAEAAAETSLGSRDVVPAAAIDNAVATVNGCLPCTNSVTPDPSMSARLLCVGLDELLLSWTKWVVDNRFYEDRTDLGWLRLPDRSPIQFGGRYFLWSFRHNHQRYFYGVIPKFTKGRMRRQKLQERHRSSKKKKDTEVQRQQVEMLAVTSTVAPVAAGMMADVSVTRTAPSAPVLVTASVACQDSLQTRNNAPEAQPEMAHTQPGSEMSSGHLRTDPSVHKQTHSFPRHASPSSHASARTGTLPKQPLPHESRTLLAAAQEAPKRVASGTHPTSTHMREHHAPAHPQPHQPIFGASVPMPHWANASATPLYVGSAPARSKSRTPQGHFAGPLNSSGSLPSRCVGSSATQPTPGFSATALNSLAAAADPTRTEVRHPPFITPPWQNSVKNNRDRADTLTSPVPYIPRRRCDPRGAPNYYYQYGGNTFIQDGKQCENEYYPPLPMHTPFHPVTVVQNLVPLPHPQTGRGGIPAIFRFWGPIGSPAHRTPAAASFPSNPSGAAVSPTTTSWATMLTSHIQHQMRSLSPQHPFTGQHAAVYLGGGSGGGGGGSTGVNILGAYHHNAAPTVVMNSSSTVPASVPASTAAAASNNLTVRLRRRTRGGSPAAIGAISVSGSACVAPLQPLSHAAPLTATGPGTPHPHSPATSSSFPATPLFAELVSMPPLVDDSGSRRLSPTSMLPTNLINEGSKTKGESVLRVEEDKYVQREAFRWNPYASTKWVQGQNGSTGGGANGSVEGDIGNPSSQHSMGSNGA